jgi:CRP-like cAMP-binding protein
MNPFVNFLISFVPLSENDIQLLENELILKKYKAGENIIQEGSICKYIMFLVTGKARSYYINHEGQEFTWNFNFNDKDSKFENRFVVDYTSFLSQTPTFLTFQVLEDIEVVALSYESIQQLTTESVYFEKVANKMSET